MRPKTEETHRAASATDGSDRWEGVKERSVRAQPCGLPYSAIRMGQDARAGSS